MQSVSACKTSRRLRRRQSALLVSALAAAVALTSPSTLAQADKRIVAIGDVHGAYDQFVAILTKAGLINAQQRWAGGKSVFISTGDYTDRGAQVRQVLDLLMAVEDGAKRGGGSAVILLGNHEVLNIIGDLRYVTPEIAATFADAKSESRRENAWKQYETLAAARAAIRPTAVYRQTRDAWMTAHPPGWLEYREALGPRGRYGRWLRAKNIATMQDGTVFMHAGISPDLAATVEAVNSRAREEIQRYERYLQGLVDRKLALPFFTLPEVLEVSAGELEAAAKIMEAAKVKGEQPDLSGFDVPLLREGLEITKIGEWSLLAGEGPLWFRGYANWPDDEASRAKVVGFLDKFSIKRFVVGHTPQKDGRITPRFGGRAVVIDTGMLVSAYQGRPSALEIRGDTLKAIYVDGEMPLTPSSAQVQVAQ